MDNRSWFYAQQNAKLNTEAEGTRNALDAAPEGAPSFSNLELEDEPQQRTLHLQEHLTQDQPKQLAHRFVRSRASRPQDTRRLISSSATAWRNMGFTFRDSRSEKSVFFGKRTIKDGECCGIWDLSGTYRAVVGPKREWLLFSRLRFCDRHVADSHQYLEIRYRNGKKDHKRGPIAMFEDPVAHESITVMNAVTVDAFEVVVVYTEDVQGNVKRSVVNGPTVFIPDVHQWLHVFRWHGSVKGGDQFTKVPGALVFTKLRTIPDQFYYNAPGVRTADDASLTVKVMIFFNLVNIELMLNSTHDPIGDFINALLADLMNFSSRNTYEQFIQCSQQLSELESFPVLCSRAEAVGFKIGKVVYRGYQASTQLQSLCDQAIKTRTELKLKQEEQEQRERMKSMEVAGSHQRGGAEREEEAARQAHRLQLEAAAHSARMRLQDEEHAERLRQLEERARVELGAKREADEAAAVHLQQLQELGVDLTRYLVASVEKQPDKVLKVLSSPSATASAAGTNVVNIHTKV